MLFPCVGYQSPQAVPRIVCLPGFDLIRAGHAHTKQILQNIKSKKERIIADSAFFFVVVFCLFNLFYKLLNWYSPKRMKRQHHQAFFPLQVKTCNAHTQHSPVTKALPVIKASWLPLVCQALPCWMRLGQSCHLSLLCFTSHLPTRFTDFTLLWAQLYSCHHPWLPSFCSCMLLVSSGFRNSSISVQLTYFINKFIAM